MTKYRSWFPICLALSLCAAVCSAGCDDFDDDEAPDTNTTAQQKGDTTASDGRMDDATVELVTLTEPKEGAFTIDMPMGWENQATLVRIDNQPRSFATALHPGGDTLLFLSDPKMPTFIEPTLQMNANNPLTKMNPMVKYVSYQTAAPFFTSYLKKKFGDKPGFRITETAAKITETAANPVLMEKLREKAQEQGLQPKLSTTLIAFEYQDKGKPIHALVNGMTMRIGQIWVADLSGVSTVGNPRDYNDLVLRIASSHQVNQEWQARESERSTAEHQRRMAMIEANGKLMTMRHEQNMAWIRNSSARHQARMDAIHAAGDAQMANWQAQQNSQDIGHQRFLNTIKGEETVVGSGGNQYQVQSGAGRYYRNTNDNSYIGTHGTVEHGDLRSAWGLNPDDYEEVKIKRR